jgi:hypothetical protein
MPILLAITVSRNPRVESPPNENVHPRPDNLQCSRRDLGTLGTFPRVYQELVARTMLISLGVRFMRGIFVLSKAVEAYDVEISALLFHLETKVSELGLE